MITIQNKQDCCGCGACVQGCPKQCISMQEDSEGFLYPMVDKSTCLDCGLCEKVCPVINKGTERKPLAVFAAKNPDEQIRKESSSGGIFTMLAERTIGRSGVVFGAAFNDDCEVEHRYTETKQGLADFRGSKYVQSKIGDTYKQAQEFLKQGREVLFSGTPCQIAGLKLYLRKEYDNLLTVDIICHGVPSPGVWRQYIEEEISRNIMPNNDRVKVKSIFFRDKEFGWKDYRFSLTLLRQIDNGTNSEFSVLYKPRENPFLQGFIRDLYSRPSCFKCPCRELKSQSDITLGDFWNIENWNPAEFDNKGHSALIVNTRKGMEKVENIMLISATYQDLISANPSLEKDSNRNIYRNIFFKSFFKGDGFYKSFMTAEPTLLYRIVNRLFTLFFTNN